MFSQVTIMGRLAGDLETRTVGDGLTLVKGSVAFSRRAKVQGEWQEKTSYIDFAMFGKRAETFARFHSKGSPVHLSGVLDQERWEAKDGQKRSRIVLAEVDFTFLPKQKDGEGSSGWGSQAVAAADSADDVPF
jgi:single-strand DNA-binding protein